ncbi:MULTISPECIES: cobyrinate a,c-diamide synthase [unclassified Solwaraspora]|uniref:cobyrinate a,c-diamide synthase n=1 Tax=unclassified Solwaraspora TaxID=2627926 RepID=UPI00248CD633|nr:MULTISPECIES: cobyrinate a,c-diamide synthase [unclassified Solwaraspora]WBB99389.1 cobyrinate a,c-diamide synthase [Solwaraspora sp. WMMA2059]WBC22061.1 cobyrinate a,c-diamide synthase [Solwaraspora sp. WMMA2080]WJK35893.1 cobyrinate a,c-diamide synthase [Solwaraspora sp. WMMA2065]
MVAVPRVVIAAPGSGHGKTTVATGLLAAFAERGVRVAGFKVGPDYIDPGYHALAAGRPGRNLDPVLVGEDLVAPLFAHGVAGVDLAVIEGVMGLYDGRVGAGDVGSTAHVAALLAAPVLLVVDAAGQSRSVAALVHGFRSFGQVHIAGVILNRVGSDRHAQVLRDACAEVGTPVLGVLRRQPSVDTPSRHLGLVPAVERTAEARASVEALAALVAASVDLDAVAAVARTAAVMTVERWSPAAAVHDAPDLGAGVGAGGQPGPADGRPVVAVAAGPAFSFGYPETVELLTAAGAEVRTVDPVRDEQLPVGTAALVVGGGFPEVYAGELSANVGLRSQVAAVAATGAPVVAECAGLLWLCRTLDGAPMCGVLPADARMTSRLTLGYRDAVALNDSVALPTGSRLTGHEFHRTEVSPRAGAAPAWGWRGAAPEGFVAAGVHASYLHLHWAARPRIAARLVAAARRRLPGPRHPPVGP